MKLGTNSKTVTYCVRIYSISSKNYQYKRKWIFIVDTTIDSLYLSIQTLVLHVHLVYSSAPTVKGILQKYFPNTFKIIICLFSGGNISYYFLNCMEQRTIMNVVFYLHVHLQYQFSIKTIPVQKAFWVLQFVTKMCNLFLSSKHEHCFWKVSALCVVVIKLSTRFGTRVGAWVNHGLVQRWRLSIEELSLAWRFEVQVCQNKGLHVVGKKLFI